MEDIPADIAGQSTDLREEIFESNKLYGPVNFMFLIIMEFVNAMSLANLHAVSYGDHYKYRLFAIFTFKCGSVYHLISRSNKLPRSRKFDRKCTNKPTFRC